MMRAGDEWVAMIRAVEARQRSGSFFTPKIWVEMSRKYIADVFGDDWQDEFYVWDCAAGTGNLLAGLANKQKVWASTLEEEDVNVIKDKIKKGENMLEEHVFQFNFLNDDFSKLPKDLHDIISDEEKRKKLIVYINPPYAEDTNKSNRTKTSFKGMVAQNAIHNKYAHLLKKANHELFAQFLARIYNEMQCCKIATFATLKALNASNFAGFRQMFQAKLESLFIVPADTFDNVNGQFPIGFHIYDTGKKENFENTAADVYDKCGNLICKKNIWICDKVKYINDWLKTFRNTQDLKKQIGVLNYRGNDFQHESYIFIDNLGAENSTKISINQNNLIVSCIYFSARKAIPANWLNNRDQFLYPNDGWKTDAEFQNDCLAYALFSNNISSKHGTNHWIPFTEKEVNARRKFESNFMTNFIPAKFSPQAKSVFEAGKKLWQHYHSKPNSEANASLYDIKEHFQGRNDKGKMNSKSDDEVYSELISALRAELKALAKKIEGKVFEYGFLRG